MTDTYATNENWPANWGRSRLTGKFIDPDGTPTRGHVWFQPEPTSITADGIIVLPDAIIVELDADGEFDVYLPATDDADINPVDWTYRVIERIPKGRTYFITALEGETNDLADVSPVASAPGSSTYPFAVIRYVGDSQPSTAGWTANDFWFDTSTEG